MSSESFAKFIPTTVEPVPSVEKVDTRSKNDSESKQTVASGTEYMDALLATVAISKGNHLKHQLSKVNKMINEKGGIAHKSTLSALLDAFVELEKTIDGPRLRELLDNAWKEDSLATLKIMWNARSIHLGK